MLIVTSKAPGWGRQKPQQYNLAHAQYSLFRNAESLGIDPQSIKLCLPFWEGAGGQHNLASDDVAILGGNTWNDNKSLYTGSTNVGQLASNININKFYCAAQITNRSTSTEERYFIGNAYVNTPGVFQIGFYSRALRIFLKDGTNSIGLNFNSTESVGTKLSVCAIRNTLWNNNVELYRNDVGVNYSNILNDTQIPVVGIGARLRDGYFDNPSLVDMHMLLLLGDGMPEHPHILTLNEIFYETPYVLLQPVAPVFYSLPSALVPQITYPTEGLNDVSTTPTISWSAVTGATKYKLQVDTANTFDSSAGLPLIEDEITAPATSKQVTLAAGTTHYARVAADTL